MRKPKQSPRTKRFTARRTISIPGALLEKAEAKAESQRRNFSSYIASLLDADLDAAEEMAGVK